ncbi:uncharacterized protein EV422DRAFT_569286 [Fimicolochytrium jonesii]|uniref:uncharacterized protein n=1 Tax=Fimicolochytrium jonesii TaxID=1396493 RepID=UPI0022FE15C9|nr:uncharacterized protein EV422DRAFT_569286 [Fimicolochytrium jonesii]KAI8819007.1 hypothetical protein EV422DRAFT_569286 [Fimicolochytrium jonesii]
MSSFDSKEVDYSWLHDDQVYEDESLSPAFMSDDEETDLLRDRDSRTAASGFLLEEVDRTSSPPPAPASPADKQSLTIRKTPIEDPSSHTIPQRATIAALPFVLRREHSRGASISLSLPQSPSYHQTPPPDSLPTPPPPCRSPTTQSPTRHLPPHIINLILSHLSHLPTVAACTTISKSWLPPALHHLYTRPCFPTTKNFHAFTQTLSQTTHGALVTHLNIPPWLADSVPLGDLDVLLQLCPNVQEFTLEGGIGVSNVLVQSIADNLGSLRTVGLRGCPVTDALVPALMGGCKMLEVVDLSYTQVSVDGTLACVLHHAANLRRLELEGCSATSSASPIPDITLLDPLQLQTLNLRATPTTDTLVRRIAKHMPHLHAVTLDSCFDISDDAIFALARSCSAALTYLDVSFCPLVTDLSLFAVAQYNKRIETVIVSGCAVTNGGVESVVRECEGLRRVVLHGCQGVEGWGGRWEVPGGPEGVMRELVGVGTEGLRAWLGGRSKGVAPAAEEMSVEGMDTSPVALRDDALTRRTTLDRGTQTEDSGQRAERTHTAAAAAAAHSNTETTEAATNVIMKLAEAMAAGLWSPHHQINHPVTNGHAYGSYPLAWHPPPGVHYQQFQQQQQRTMHRMSRETVTSTQSKRTERTELLSDDERGVMWGRDAEDAEPPAKVEKAPSERQGVKRTSMIPALKRSVTAGSSGIPVPRNGSVSGSKAGGTAKTGVGLFPSPPISPPPATPAANTPRTARTGIPLANPPSPPQQQKRWSTTSSVTSNTSTRSRIPAPTPVKGISRRLSSNTVPGPARGEPAAGVNGAGIGDGDALPSVVKRRGLVVTRKPSGMFGKAVVTASDASLSASSPTLTTTTMIRHTAQKPTPNGSSAEPMYKPRLFRRFNTAPGDITTTTLMHHDLRAPTPPPTAPLPPVPVEAGVSHAGMRTPRPSTPVNPIANGGSGRSTHSGASGASEASTPTRPPPASRVRWSHHLEPSAVGVGWISGGEAGMEKEKGRRGVGR